jgi:hypothetical protein
VVTTTFPPKVVSTTPPPLVSVKEGTPVAAHHPQVATQPTRGHDETRPHSNSNNSIPPPLLQAVHHGNRTTTTTAGRHNDSVEYEPFEYVYYEYYYDYEYDDDDEGPGSVATGRLLSTLPNHCDTLFILVIFV